MHWIIVDDDPSTIDFLTPFVELKGIKYETYTRAEDALRAFERNPKHYDAAILDMCMPGYTGTEIASQMRVLNSRIQFLFFTGLDDKYNVQLAEQYGAYLHKPPWPDDVFNAITHLVESVGHQALARDDGR